MSRAQRDRRGRGEAGRARLPFAAVGRLVARGGPWLLVAVLSVTVAVLAALLVLGGGDGPDETVVPPPAAGGEAVPGANQEFDGCRLIQSWDAEDVLRGPVRSVEKPSESPAAATCVWESGVGETARSFQFSVFRGTDLYDPAAFEDDETFEKVQDVGDDAFFVEPSGVQLHVLAGDFSVLFSVSGLDDDVLDRETVKDRLVELARRIGSRL